MTDQNASMITPELVRLDVALGSDKTEVIRALARIAAEAGRSTNPDGLAEDALAREVEAAGRAGDKRRARALAEEFVARYPDGRRASAVRRAGGLD